MHNEKLLNDIKSLPIDQKLKLNQSLLNCPHNSQVVLTVNGRCYTLSPKKDVRVK